MQTFEIDKLEEILRKILREDLGLLKRLVKEVIDEQKVPVVQENVALESSDISNEDDTRVLNNIDAIMSKHDNLLKRLAQ